MRQKRSLTGTKFENEICKSLGWTHKPKSPKIKWNGKGKSNLDKMAYCFYNNTPLNILYTKSNFDKYDAIDNNNNKIEIKKYDSKKCFNWKLYSEPLIKIASNKNICKVTELFGNGNEKLGRSNYNEMIESTYQEFKDILLKEITKSIQGIQFKDKFITKENLEFRIIIKEKSWKGYNRVTIQFRIIENTNIKKTFLEWITN